MLPDSLTLSVDATNEGTPSNEVYTRYIETENRSQYIGATHALDARDQLTFYRTFPNRNGNFKGVAKSAFKFTADTTVPGIDGADISAPVLIEVSVSAPVGATDALLEHMRQRALALIDDSTNMVKLNNQLQV